MLYCRSRRMVFILVPFEIIGAVICPRTLIAGVFVTWLMRVEVLIALVVVLNH